MFAYLGSSDNPGQIRFLGAFTLPENLAQKINVQIFGKKRDFSQVYKLIVQNFTQLPGE